MTKIFFTLRRFVITLTVMSLSIPFYVRANTLTMGLAGQIKDRCEITFLSGNVMTFSEQKTQSLPFSLYCNRPLGITINSQYGGLKYEHQGVELIENYELSLQVDELRLNESRLSRQLLSPAMIDSSGVIPFTQRGVLRVTLENNLLYAGYYHDVIEIEVYPSIHSVTK
ncbi:MULTISPECIES: hypothetical protein [Vibrio]|uniref:hypothetical protein n=1 Tax=Vibrio TaxID=662 RepID=UPI001CDB83F6|nr:MULTISPECIES: hypothetical protein [Vibrio]MDF4657352.1 hypothetical protein [Vibrio parahaemolyticus]MCA2452414.1 hypothetical protein [Vibrio alginolyticus]MCA2474043.1 hypothetical protein [Vibrio alginolyticus]MCR9639116.1 hypothetical protein [Vibrio alginolyticus]MDW1497658.1 hypothetical protein [Vibrio sp. YT-19(2023)]